MLLDTLPIPDMPWGLATTAAGVAVLMVVLFLRAIASMRVEHTTEMQEQRKAHAQQVKDQRDAHSAEMKEQRVLFVGSMKEFTATNAASAERVEVALRDLAMELRSGQRPVRKDG